MCAPDRSMQTANNLRIYFTQSDIASEGGERECVCVLFRERKGAEERVGESTLELT